MQTAANDNDPLADWRPIRARLAVAEQVLGRSMPLVGGDPERLLDQVLEIARRNRLDLDWVLFGTVDGLLRRAAP